MTRDTGWFKSSHSDAGTDNCVEVRIIGDRAVGVRDTKDRDAGALWFASRAWTAFLRASR